MHKHSTNIHNNNNHSLLMTNYQ